MGRLNDIVYRAVVAYNHNAEMATQIIMDLNKKSNTKHKKGRKSIASKKNKKRWY